ncbi:MAG: putative metallopeptidase [Anaerolineaceae bacterium]
MAVEWKEADPSVETIVKQMISQYHRDLLPLSIGVLYRSEPQASAGRDVLANISKVNAKLKPFLDYDLILWVSKPDWEGRLTENQRMALIDHELCHVEIDGDDQITIIHHDIEEFREVIARWGLWSKDLVRSEQVLKHATQGELFATAPETTGKVETIPEMVISHIKPDGQTESVELGPGEFDRVANKLIKSTRRMSHVRAD